MQWLLSLIGLSYVTLKKKNNQVWILQILLTVYFVFLIRKLFLLGSHFHITFFILINLIITLYSIWLFIEFLSNYDLAYALFNFFFLLCFVIVLPNLHISLSLHSSSAEFFSTLRTAETSIWEYSESLTEHKTILERNGGGEWAS